MKNRKTMKPAKFDELDRVLYEWFKQRRSEGIPISGFILREKAREFHQTMDLEELLLYYIIIIFGEKFDYPVNSIIRTGAGPVESGLPSFYCITINSTYILLGYFVNTVTLTSKSMRAFERIVD